MADIIDPLIPPYRFERVQSGLYRGGYPKPRNHRFLRRQRLRTIVSLIPGDNDNSLARFCEAEHIDHIVIEVASPNENVTVTEETVSRSLELITDPARAPLYIHCLDGSNVTGVTIMCLRKLQLWRVASYQNEYLRFEQNGEIVPEESEFVDAYAGRALCLPNPYVGWLWPGREKSGGEGDGDAGLPFKDGTHPVVPFVGLRPKAPVISRAVSGPAALDAGASDVGRSVEHSNRRPGPGPDVDPIRIVAAGSDVAGAHPTAAVVVSAADATALKPSAQPVHLHTSHSAGVLCGVGTEVYAEPEHEAVPEHEAAPETGGSGASGSPRVRRLLGPILAALAANPTAPLASLASPPVAATGNNRDIRRTGPDASICDSRRGPGADYTAASASSAVRSAARTGGVPANNRPPPLAIAAAAAAAAATANAAGLHGTSGTAIKEIALSRLVQALAIEGLGM
ncbi:protein-tyrosine-phosphatase [Coemansia sp. BCRC 34490]|nr:protein-tyrosine-phosphatase [Coemansia sp. BCRC 34490]